MNKPNSPRLLDLIRNPFFLIIPLSLIFFLFDFLSLDFGAKAIPLALSISIYFLMRKAPVQAFIGKRTGAGSLFFVVIMLYAGFASIGHQVFFVTYPVPQPIVRVLFYLLFCGWLSFVAIAFLYFTDVCKSWLLKRGQLKPVTAAYSTGKLYLIFAGTLIVCWSLYLIGFYPATMSPDSIEQWRQAHGLIPLNDAHPVFHTLIIRALTAIWDSPAIVALSQLLFMAAVCASFFVYLYKAGIPFRWLLVLTIFMGIMPMNGIMAVTLWKDIPFCVSIVWLTLILIELLTQTYIINKKVTLVCLVVSLIGVALLRHNGVPVALATAVVLVYFGWKNKRKEMYVPVGCFLLVFFAYKKVVMPALKVPPVPSGYQLTAPMHGMGSVLYYDKPLSAEAMQEMQKVLPLTVWKENYTPYSADPYLEVNGNTDSSFVNKLSQIPTGTVMRLYGSTFAQYPFLIMKDRLCGAELLWNTFQGEGASNYSSEPGLVENEFGFKHSENGLKKVLMGLIKFAGRAIDPISRRVGIFNIILALLFLNAIRSRKNYWIIFLPLVATNGFLLISMTYQAYRYVYYIPLLVGFMWLFSVSRFITPVLDKSDEKKIDQ